jgi:hypothetical protein
MSDDRKHVHPLAIAVLDGMAIGTERPAYRRFVDGRCPVLSARCSAVMAAVEEAMGGVCGRCPLDDCTECTEKSTEVWTAIRAAWRTP